MKLIISLIIKSNLLAILFFVRFHDQFKNELSLSYIKNFHKLFNHKRIKLAQKNTMRTNSTAILMSPN